MYHVTFKKNLKSIRQRGIVPGWNGPVWRKAGNGEAYGSPDVVFAFENEDDAIRWAALMDWDFHTKTGSGKIAIVTFASSADWRADTADPLRRLGSIGRWLKSKTAVSPDLITETRLVTSDMIKASFQKRNAA